MEQVKGSVKRLSDNSYVLFTEAVTVLVKIVDNILANPHNDKFRVILKSNRTINKKIISVEGGVDCLLAMGFEENASDYQLPMNKSLDNLKAVKKALIEQQNIQDQALQDNQFAGLLNPNEDSDETCSNSSQESVDALEVPSVVLPPFEQIFSHDFLRRMELSFHLTLAYKDKKLLEYTRKLIPITQLERLAQIHLRDLQERIKKNEIPDPNVGLQDLLILELLKWFKNDFFTWVDNPNCDKCNSKTKFHGMAEEPSRFGQRTRIELYSCETCKHQTPFRRFDDPTMLLVTRRGRCGEWGNCFTLICVAMGWDARFVVDSTDHVWTEVYSFAQQRWLHCDPCEGICDTPLIYETGWGKKLTYIIAYSAEEVQDVTWRYSNKHRELLARRDRIDEVLLINAMIKLRERRQQDLSLSRKQYLIKRLLLELVELMVEKEANEDDKHGRISGAYAWRIARGETHETNTSQDFVWTLHPNSEITIRFSASKNQYEYLRPEYDAEFTTGWNMGCFKISNVFRKVENDWKMVYLARIEGSSEGSAVWKYQVANPTKTIDTISLKFVQKIYENGVVKIRLCSENNCVVVPPSDSTCFKTGELTGSSWITLHVELSGGKGNVGWQHAQLFRQSLNDEEFPFIITFTFK